MPQAHRRNVLIWRFFPTSFYNSCISWETAIEVFLCKSVNHYQLADVILCWDNSIFIYAAESAASVLPLALPHQYPDCQCTLSPVCNWGSTVMWSANICFVKCSSIRRARQLKLWDASPLRRLHRLHLEIKIKNYHWNRSAQWERLLVFESYFYFFVFLKTVK